MDDGLRSHPFWMELRNSRHQLLMTDYDGTLAPFCLKREDAFPWPGVTECLAEMGRLGSSVVVISGRRASEVARLLGEDLSIEIWGCHGGEHRSADGRISLRKTSPDIADVLGRARRVAGEVISEQRIEVKPLSVALHWRGMGEPERVFLEGRIGEAWRGLAEEAGLRLLAFDGGLEIMAPEFDKGSVVNLLMDGAEEYIACYMGDDLTDEDAFRALRGRGLSVLVRPTRRSSAADLWIRPPAGLLSFLRRWIEILRLRGVSNGR